MIPDQNSSRILNFFRLDALTGLVGHKENQLRRRLQKTPDALHGEIIEAARTARRGGGPPALPGDLAPVPLGRMRRKTAAFDPTQS